MSLPSDDRPPTWKRYRDVLRRPSAEEVDDELKFHLEMRVAEGKRIGMSDHEARAAAHERFGEVSAIEAELLRINRARDRRLERTAWLADLRHDAIFALRSLRRAPSFAVAAIATLAIAIGANTAIYSVVHALLLSPLPYGHPEQLATTTANWGWSTGELVALRDQFRSATDVAAYIPWSTNLDDGTLAERVDAATVSSNFFSLLQSPPIVGRTFAVDESDPGKNRVLVLSEALWRRRFAGDTSVVGTRVLIDGVPTTIVGVMPASFALPSATTAFWEPFVINRADPMSLWTSAGHRPLLRLRQGVTIDAARRELRQLVPGLRHANTVWDPGPQYGKGSDIKGFQDALVDTTKSSLLLLLGCAGLVLLVACANVANLLLARATARERELVVRAALGGGRWRLVRQLLTESVVLSMVGGVLGLVLAATGVRWIVSALPPSVPRASEITLNIPALAFTAALTIVTGIAFGLLPAIRATTDRSSADATRLGRSAGSSGHQRIATLLVAGEVALAVLLAIGAQLLVRSFTELRRLDPGFRTSHIVSARVTPARASFADEAHLRSFYETVLTRLAAMPGVERVGGTSALPIARSVYGMAARVEGQFEDMTHSLPMIDHAQFVTPGYLPTMGVRLVAGRGLTEQDRGGAEAVAVISASMANKFWPGPVTNALGKRIGFPVKSPWITVVGVAADVRVDSLRDPTGIAAYIPFEQRPGGMGIQPELTLVASTTGDPASLGQAIRGLIQNVDRSVPVSEVRTMEDVVGQSVAKPRFTMTLVGAFALVALVLGAVGIYGVMSYVVSQRSQELSIRSALGASTTTILAMIVGRATLLAVSGALVGAVAALAAVRPLRAMLYGVSPTDPWTYATVSLLFIGVAVVASAAPARRAARSDPASALRNT